MSVVQARQLKLPGHHGHHHHSLSLSSSPALSSILFDPTFLSLSLMHADSSFSLYPSLSPLSLPLPPPSTIVPPPSSSAAFLHLQNPNPNCAPRLFFVVSSPLSSGSSVLLRFWILRNDKQSFTKYRVVCAQRHMAFDEGKFGVVFRVPHGVAVKLAGSVNVFAMYSVSNRKVWVFAVKMAGEEEDGVEVKLMKCATIDCTLPVFSICILDGFLILGEEEGVRVFPLRPLVKGRFKKDLRDDKNVGGVFDNCDGLEGRKLNLSNWGIREVKAKQSGHVLTNGLLEEYIGQHSNRAKLKSVKLRQNSSEGGVCFVAFRSKEIESFKSTDRSLKKSVKAVSIQKLLPR